MKREPNAWIKALMLYNSAKGDYCIPRKNTPDYFKVKELMNAPAVPQNPSIPKPRRIRVIRQYNLQGKYQRQNP